MNKLTKQEELIKLTNEANEGLTERVTQLEKDQSLLLKEKD